jgi:hypothetical protein
MASKVLLLAIIVSLLGIFAGCAEERSPVDRVQPYALEKALFIGEDFNDPADNPEFWTQGTLIDVGYGAAQDGLFTSTYAQPMSRMKWQVTEDLLLGRLAYERIEGSDGKGAGSATNDGVIVVAFKIEKHFDIVRAYNPTTGEEINVIEENSTDRPWYEREYMRVDWSKNQNVDSYDFDTLSLIGVYGGVEYEPLAIDITDPSDENAPFFDLQNGYFDVTSKAFAKPGVVDLSHLGWGIDSFPACFLPDEFSGGSYPAGSCNPIELTIRQSFRQVVDTDYEPKHWDGFRFQAYGAFTVERHGYTRNYGMSDDKWHRFITRYQIWQRSHYYTDPENMTGYVECFTPETTPFGADPHRDEDNNGTEDECESVGNGSKCDTFRQRCTLPYAERTPKTIAWYYSKDSDLEFFDATEMAAHEWDVALRVAVRTAKYAECMRIGGTNCLSDYPIYFGQEDDNLDAVMLAREVDDCRNGLAYAGQDCDQLADEIGQLRGVDPGVISIAKMPEMIVMCHSPVEASDHAACGSPRLPQGITAAACDLAYEAGDHDLSAVCKQAINVRRGDLRYHMINVIKEPATPSPWGIYTDSEDPLTGETVAASINVWSWVNDKVSQSVIDKIRYIQGELKTEDVTEGSYIRNWVQAAQASSGGGVLPKLTKEQFDGRIASFAGGHNHSHDHDHGQLSNLPPDILHKARKLKEELKHVVASAKAPSSNKAIYEARKLAAAGTEFEAELLTPMVQQLTGILGFPMNEAIMQIASPLRGANPSFERDLYNLKQMALAERGACILHPNEAAAPLSITALGDVLEEKFGLFNAYDPLSLQQQRAERMRKFIARRLHYSVIVHEMGHSIGMRHNFVSSSDAWQYRPQYWQLRTKNGQVTDECTELDPDGESCVGPRFYDPVTQEERDNMIWMWMHSSVMEYPGEITQDMMGLGVFDFAAARMFYGDTVAVNADPSFGVGTPKGLAMLSKMDNFGGILGISHAIGDEDFHYSQLQNKYGLISDCQQVEPDDFMPDRWNLERDGDWHPIIDGLLVKVDGAWTRCKQQKVDYVPWTALEYPTAQQSQYYYGGPAVDDQGRVRMPYGFGTDSWADLGNVSVYRHDNGADPYEIFNFMITQQEVGHIFDNYRRGRQNFSVRAAANRTLNRFNAKIRDGAKGLGLFKGIYEDLALEVGYDGDSFWAAISGWFFPDNIIASSLAFDHFTRLLDRPEVGPHFFLPGDNVLRSNEDAWASHEESEFKVTVPNGATGYYDDVGIGGKLVENKLASDQGEYDTDYTVNAGSYYDKLYSAMLMTESVDNFISSSRTDFIDPRYRAVSLAEIFPDGYRRWLANNLTGDDELKGPRVAAQSNGMPITESSTSLYPATPIGWTSWWTEDVEVCFPNRGTNLCTNYASPHDGSLNPQAPDNVAILDPQVGWEQHKFLIAWTMLYLPENERMNWLNMMTLWELGRDANPDIDNRIEFHDPTGKTYFAKTFGQEVIFGKTVQRGIAARVLEYANELLNKGYETTPVDYDNDGDTDWYIASLNPATGQPLVKYDNTIDHIDAQGYVRPNGVPGCNATDNSECTCSANRACIALKRYVSVPAYLREALTAYQLGEPEPRGIY